MALRPNLFVTVYTNTLYVDYLDYIKTCVIKANKSNYIVSVFGVWCKLRIPLSIVRRQVTTPGPDTRHQTLLETVPRVLAPAY